MTDRTRLNKLKKLVQQNPDGAFALYGLAMEYRSLGEFENAAAAFEDLLTRHPDYSAAFLQFGTTLIDLEQPDKARQIFLSGIQICRQTGQDHARSELQEALDQLAKEDEV